MALSWQDEPWRLLGLALCGSLIPGLALLLVQRDTSRITSLILVEPDTSRLLCKRTNATLPVVDLRAPLWRSARVYPGKRCSRELAGFGSVMVAQRMCDHDKDCKGIMLNRKDNRGQDARTVCEGWFQTCGGNVASEPSTAWDVIVKPVAGASAATATPTADPGPPRFTLWLETKGGMGNQILQLFAVLALAEAANATDPLANVSMGLSQRHASIPTSQVFETYNSVTSSFKSFLMPQPPPSPDCGCTFEEGVDVREPFRRTWSFPEEDLDPWCEDWAAVVARELVARFRHCSHVRVSGYFQNRRYYERLLPRFRELFWHEPTAQRAERALARLGVHRDSWDLTVSVHYRLGDVVNGWEVRDSYFPQALNVARKQLGGSRNLTCVIFSDTPALAWNRSRALTSCKRRVAAPQLDPGISFYMMALIPNSVLTLSSFSYAAALAGRKKLVIVPSVKFAMFEYLQQHGWVALRTSMKGCRRYC